MDVLDELDYRLIGRWSLLQQYLDAWKKDRRIFGFYGMTKVGKTRLCAEFLQCLNDLKDFNLVTVTFDFKKIHCYEDFEKILFLKFNINSSSSIEGREKLINYIKNKNETKFVFVFDSLEEAMPKAKKDGSGPDNFVQTLWDHLYDNIVNTFLKECQETYFCLTSSTWAKFARYAKKAFLQTIPPLTRTDSVILLEQVLSGEIQDRSHISTIAELCDGLPGSIINVGTDMVVHKEELCNEEMLTVLLCRKLEALSSDFLPASIKIGDCLNGVISKLSREHQTNLKVLAASGPGMSMNMAAHAFDYQKVALFKFDVLIPLKYKSLVDTDGKHISVHPVTQEFMKIYHASTTTKDREIAKRLRSLLEDCCNNVDPDKGKPPEYVDQLKDYCNQGFPERFVPMTTQREMGSGNVEPRSGITTGSGHTSAGIPRLNDLSPATSTEKDDKGFDFNCNTNLQTMLDQKPSLKKNIVYTGPATGIQKKDEVGHSAKTSVTTDLEKCLNCNDNVPHQPKRLSEIQYNLGCSIEENDRIPTERRLSEIYKRKNLSRSLSAQEKFPETKPNNLNRALTLQEKSDYLQQKRNTLNRSDAFEDTGDTKSELEESGAVNWDDCSGSSQNITSDEANIPRNSSCELNDIVSLDDNVNVDIINNKDKNGHKRHNDITPVSALFQKYSNKDINNDDPPIVRPKTSLTCYQSMKNDGNSLKRLLFGQISCESETDLKQPVKEAVEHSFVPSLNLSSLTSSLDSNSCSENINSHASSLDFDSLCKKDNRQHTVESNSNLSHELPRFSLLSTNSRQSIDCTRGNTESLKGSNSGTNKNHTSAAPKIQNRAEKLKMILKNDRQ